MKQTTKGTTRINRTFSFHPRHLELVRAEALRRVDESGKKTKRTNESEVIQDLIDEGLGDSKSSRFSTSTSLFNQDCEDLLRDAGATLSRDGGASSSEYRVSFKRRKEVRLILIQSSRPSYLEPALGRAMVLSHESQQPVVICVPYLLNPSTATAFSRGGLSLCTPETLVKGCGG